MTLTLTDAEADLVFRALVERPYREVAQLVPKLAQQAREQVAPAPTPSNPQ